MPDLDPAPTTPERAVEASRDAYREAREAYRELLPLAHTRPLLGVLTAEQVTPGTLRVKRNDAVALAQAARHLADALTRASDELERPLRENR